MYLTPDIDQLRALFEYGNKPSGFINVVEFLNYLSGYQIPKNDSI